MMAEFQWQAFPGRDPSRNMTFFDLLLEVMQCPLWYLLLIRTTTKSYPNSRKGKYTLFLDGGWGKEARFLNVLETGNTAFDLF